MAGLRFQFRLRSLMIAVTIIAVLCAVSLPALKEWKHRRDQQKRIEAVQETLRRDLGGLGSERLLKDGPD